MNILIRELKTGLKSFCLWLLGMAFLIVAGMQKYTAFGSDLGGFNVNDVFNKMPKIIIAIIGAVGVDMNTLSGFYAMLVYYALICAIIYAINLGCNAVSREAIDKTYEFIFTKPLSRSRILAIKLIAASIYLALFCAMNYVLSLAGISLINTSENIITEIFYFTLQLFFVSFIFFSIAAFFSAAVSHAEKGALFANLTFLFTFIVSIIFDTLEDGGIIKLFSPMKYFEPADILNLKFDFVFALISILLIALFIWGAFKAFNKKDLIAA